MVALNIDSIPEGILSMLLSRELKSGKRTVVDLNLGVRSSIILKTAEFLPRISAGVRLRDQC